MALLGRLLLASVVTRKWHSKKSAGGKVAEVPSSFGTGQSHSKTWAADVKATYAGLRTLGTPFIRLKMDTVYRHCDSKQ